VYIFNQSFGLDNTIDYPMDVTVEAQYAYGASTLRGGKGALYVKSAGNGFKNLNATDCSGATAIGISCQNANFDPSNTVPYNIVVGALNAKGKKSSYSTAGSAIWASTPGGEYGYNSAAITAAGYVAPAAGNAIYDPAMVTTDQSGCASGQSVSTVPTGSGPFSFFNWGGTNLSSINFDCNYTNGMNGTSSAAPMMSGVIALILEANPALTWREVKDILAKTSVKVDASIAPVTVALGNGTYVAEQGWVTNAAGYKFHNWYGFGAVNAAAAVAMARTYAASSIGTFVNSGWINSGTLSLSIADNSVTGRSVSLVVPAVGAHKVETVQIQVTTTDTGSGYTGDLGIELTSPSGTKSILKNIQDGFNGNNLAGMVLTSNAFYGENSNGTWTVKVVDGWAGLTQTLTNVRIRVYGH
jgi:subtilisin-like proprotein convertase family protein